MVANPLQTFVQVSLSTLGTVCPDDFGQGIPELLDDDSELLLLIELELEDDNELLEGIELLELDDELQLLLEELLELEDELDELELLLEGQLQQNIENPKQRTSISSYHITGNPSI